MRHKSVMTFLMASIYLNAFAATYADLKKIVMSPDVKTIPLALSLLPAEMISNYSLMHDSKSLQQSNPMFPRAILFGNTADLVVTFNGLPQHNGYNALEVASFDQSSKRIQFRKIVFRIESSWGAKWDRPTALQYESLYENEIEYFDEKILISKPNPMLCMACHAANPDRMDQNAKLPPEQRLAKYNWQGYPRWKGAYGENNDHLESYYDHSWKEEKETFKAFKRELRQNQKEYARYQIFKDQPQHMPFSPSEKIHQFRYKPNFRLTTMLSINYAKQMVDLISKDAFYQKNKTQILRDLYTCDKVSNTQGLAGYQYVHRSVGRMTLNGPLAALGSDRIPEKELDYNTALGAVAAAKMRQLVGLELIVFEAANNHPKAKALLGELDRLKEYTTDIPDPDYKPEVNANLEFMKKLSAARSSRDKYLMNDKLICKHLYSDWP